MPGISATVFFIEITQQSQVLVPIALTSVANGEAGNVGDQIEAAGHVLALVFAKRKESAGLLVVEIQHSMPRLRMSQAVAVETRKRISLHSGENC